jgi:O-acetyl-ADP-ribose deacetylase (regulator of RNase III)
MLRYVSENIFHSPAQTLVNTVNCVGVMGKGIAKGFKEIYPDMFKAYQRLCEQKKLTIGKLWAYPTRNKTILNFPTKVHWRQPSEYAFLEQGLENFADNYTYHKITSISFPQLGCGNGGLEWAQVKVMMEKHLSQLPIDIFIHLYEPDSDFKPERLDKTFVDWLRNTPADLSFDTFWEDVCDAAREHTSLASKYASDLFFVEAPSADSLLYSVSGTEVQSIHKEYVQELWSLFKYHGFLSFEFFADVVKPHYEFLMSLFAALPYAKPIQIGDDEHSLSFPKSYALRLQTQSFQKNAVKQFEFSF